MSLLILRITVMFSTLPVVVTRHISCCYNQVILKEGESMGTHVIFVLAEDDGATLNEVAFVAR